MMQYKLTCDVSEVFSTHASSSTPAAAVSTSSGTARASKQMSSSPATRQRWCNSAKRRNGGRNGDRRCARGSRRPRGAWYRLRWGIMFHRRRCSQEGPRERRKGLRKCLGCMVRERCHRRHHRRHCLRGRYREKGRGRCRRRRGFLCRGRCRDLLLWDRRCRRRGDQLLNYERGGGVARLRCVCSCMFQRAIRRTDGAIPAFLRARYLNQFCLLWFQFLPAFSQSVFSTSTHSRVGWPFSVECSCL